MYSQSFSLDTLLLDKAPSPLKEADLLELERIQNLDVSSFNEADVRAEIIDPMIRILGYQKGKYFSVDREKHIRFADKKNGYIDYNLTLWEKNFWIIEAKRPNFNKDRFGFKELSQVVQYAVNPEIDAALVMLCDGRNLEVFDREKDLSNPALRISIPQIRSEFENLRKLLDPVNVWFFYKRRIIRFIDRAFEHEVNQNRVVEFGDIIAKRLDEKRARVFDNIRRLDIPDDFVKNLQRASVDEIVDIHFFMDSPTKNAAKIMIDKLVRECVNNNSFNVMQRIFPENPRDVNDSYFMYSLLFLFELEKADVRIDWLPRWLMGQASKGTIQNATKRLIQLCLTYFAKEESLKTILLTYNTYRRIHKILSDLDPAQWRLGEIRQAIMRFRHPEFSLGQILFTPERHTFLESKRMTMLATSDFVRRHLNEQQKFNSHLAKQELKTFWDFENEVLNTVQDYKEIKAEHKYGDFHPIEKSSVVYDSLGHNSLCVIKEFPEWKEYIFSKHFPEVYTLACMGSWAARELLNNRVDPSTYELMKDNDLAERFFMGDITRFQKLKTAYGFEKLSTS